MKYLKKIILGISISIFFVGISQESSAQCRDESGVFKCAEMFTPDGITFMNEFNIEGKKRKSEADENGREWDIYLLAERKYRFALCCYEGLDDIVMTLYNDESPENAPLGTTFQSGKDYVFFDFTNHVEGQYKVSIRFKPGKGVGQKLCAIGLLGYGGKTK